MFRRENGEKNDNSTLKTTAATNSGELLPTTSTTEVPAAALTNKLLRVQQKDSSLQLQKLDNDEVNEGVEEEMIVRRLSERELRRPYEVQTPTKYRKPLLRHHHHHATDDGTSKSHSTVIQHRTTPTATASISRTQSQPSPLPSQIRPSRKEIELPPTTPTVSTKKFETVAGPQHNNNDIIQAEKVKKEICNNPATVSSHSATPQTKQRTENTKTKRSNNTKRQEFQFATDLPSVQVRHVNVTQRSAFAHYSLTPLLRKVESTLAQLPSHKHHRVSPSLHHIQALHRMHHTHIVRQIQFSPSTSIDADYHYQMQQQQQSNERSKDGGNGRNTVPPSKRDGRYRCIDPTKLQNIFRHIEFSSKDTDKFPSPPQFSYRKHRLPNRADVGFGRCTDDEIQLKQEEIRNETTWELARVRTTCVISCIDLIRMSSSSAINESDDALITRYLPYAGRHLRAALTRKWCTNRHNDDPLTEPTPAENYESVLPNPYSILAPPIESTYSASQGWRPRIFHDRPTGLRYCYVSPMNVTIWGPPPPHTRNEKRNGNSANIIGRTNHQSSSSHMVGSLALYTLPPLSKRLLAKSSASQGGGTLTAATAAAYHCQKMKSVPAYGKISEEFYFPINSLHIPPTDTSSNMPDSGRKAIFSYNPLDLVMETITQKSSAIGPDSLYIVVRVYEVIPLVECSEPSKQLMKDLAFGITKVFSKTTMIWPDGQV